MNGRSIAEGFLFTDQYQLTMAQLYFRVGMHERPASFDHFFRSYPDYGAHRAGYCVNAGLGWLLDWMEEARFGGPELELLRQMRTGSGRRLFEEDFLAWLSAQGGFDAISLRSVPEGRVVHAHAPVTVVQGPLALAQILETPLLNILNYQTLIATKAARLRHSAGSSQILEFGARRAHDRGANAGTRASLIGGADFSSNAGVSHLLGYPPKGTHGHSMVQAFIAQGLTEADAFQAYADVYPDGCLLVVDTVDTLESGLPNAIRVFERLRRRGFAPLGVRLDSGDLAHLSVRAAKMLDGAGFHDAGIVLSNDLDEIAISRIRQRVARGAAREGMDADAVVGRLIYGVGTRLVTSTGDGSLGGVYKMAAVRHEGGWRPAVKLSEEAAKTTVPGRKRVWRLYDRGGLAVADLLTLDDEDPRPQPRNDAGGAAGMEARDGPATLRHPYDPSLDRRLPPGRVARVEPLLVDAAPREGRGDEGAAIEQMRAARRRDVALLDAAVRRLVEPEAYFVGVSERLRGLKAALLESLTTGRKGRSS